MRGQFTYHNGVSNSTTTYTSATAAFTSDDVDRPITGTNIPADTTIAERVSATTITLSQAATGTGTSLTFSIGQKVPLITKVGRLPFNYEFAPDEYLKIFMQRAKLYISGENVFLGSTSEDEPARNSGAWFNAGTMFAWSDSLGRYVPADIGIVNSVTADGATRTYGMSIVAAPTANRTLTIPDAPQFTDGVSNSTTTYTSATANFVDGDVGKGISGTNIPAGTTIVSRTNSTTVTLLYATTGTASGLSFRIGRPATALLVTDLTVPKETVILTGTTPTIDASLSSNFYLVLEGDTTIQPLTNMTAGKKIKIGICNDGTAYTVTWPSSGADEIQWPSGSSPTQPVSDAGQPAAIGIYTISRIDAGLTSNLWGDPEADGFVAPPTPDPGGTIPPDYDPLPPPHGTRPYDRP